MKEEELIVHAFQTLWNDRSSLEELNYSKMSDIIRAELLDELSHPRVRKTPLEKFALAKRRIEESSIPDHSKNGLILLYQVQLEQLERNVNPN